MKSIENRLQEESLKAFPILTSVNGIDCNEHKRQEWIGVCKKGIEILWETIDSLKNTIHVELENTDPIDSKTFEELDAMLPDVTMSKNIIEFITNLNSWTEVGYDTDRYNRVLEGTQELEPIDTGNSLHCHHAEYEFDGLIYRLTWEIGNKNKPIIEYKQK
jgi:hypothetical protein